MCVISDGSWLLREATSAPWTELLSEKHAAAGGRCFYVGGAEMRDSYNKGEENVLVPFPLTFFISLCILRAHTNSCRSHACYLCEGTELTWPSSYAVCFKEADFLLFLLVQLRCVVSEIQSRGFVASIVVYILNPQIQTAVCKDYSIKIYTSVYTVF